MSVLEPIMKCKLFIQPSTLHLKFSLEGRVHPTKVLLHGNSLELGIPLPGCLEEPWVNFG